MTPLATTITMLALPGPQAIAADAYPPAIIGGEDVDSCAWPTAARATVSSTSFAASLIHPRVVALTDALPNLFPDAQSYQFSFGNVAVGSPPPPALIVTAPVANCTFEGTFGVCTLDEPLPFPSAPPLFGCEAVALEPGDNVTIVGFGDIGPESNRTKRAATMTVSEISSLLVYLEGEAGPCTGDAGSPAFRRMNDGSWRTVAISVGGGPRCGDAAAPYISLSNRVAWIEEVTGIDVTPCHGADGLPDPGPSCDELYAGDADDVGTWPELYCSDGPVSGAGGVCSGDADAPTVAIEAPAMGEQFPDAPASLVVEASADDQDGLGIRDLRLAINGETLPNERTEPPYTFEVELPEGIWTLTVLARDWGGNVRESAEVEVVVGDTPEPGTGTGENDDSTSGPTEPTSGGPDADPPSETTEATEPGGTDSQGDTEGAAQTTGGSDGCTAAGRKNRPWLVLVLGAGLFVRRRRSRRARRTHR